MNSWPFRRSTAVQETGANGSRQSVAGAALALASLFFSFCAVGASEPGGVPASGSPITDQAKHEGLTGALVIVGGGGLPDAIRERFLRLAGGKEARLVIIPTANSKVDEAEPHKGYAVWQSQPVASVSFLHTRDRSQANNPDFVHCLRKATGVWFSGGDQSLLVDAYRGTAVEAELRKLLARGGVIGGTSAGAAVMSALMITGGNPRPELGRGFGFLPWVVVDQHFSNRKRQSRLLWAVEHNPRYVGVGIDEQTAVIVCGRTLTVVGNQKVHVCLPSEGQARFQVLQAGDQADLLALYETVVGSENPAQAVGLEAQESRTSRPPSTGSSSRQR
jgi:cyanophycinase